MEHEAISMALQGLLAFLAVVWQMMVIGGAIGLLMFTWAVVATRRKP